MSTKPKDQPDEQEQPEKPPQPKPDEPQGNPKSPKETTDLAATAIDSQFTPEDQFMQTRAVTVQEEVQAGQKIDVEIETEEQDLEAEIQAGRKMKSNVEGNEIDPEPDLQAGRKMRAHVDTAPLYYEDPIGDIPRKAECPKCGWPIEGEVLERACEHREALDDARRDADAVLQ